MYGPVWGGNRCTILISFIHWLRWGHRQSLASSGTGEPCDARACLGLTRWQNVVVVVCLCSVVIIVLRGHSPSHIDSVTQSVSWRDATRRRVCILSPVWWTASDARAGLRCSETNNEGLWRKSTKDWRVFEDSVTSRILVIRLFCFRLWTRGKGNKTLTIGYREVILGTTSIIECQCVVWCKPYLSGVRCVRTPCQENT